LLNNHDRDFASVILSFKIAGSVCSLQIQEFERIGLGNLPTPLEFMPRLSEKLGPSIFVKRDDMTGLAMGGNKVRKLDFLLADARRKKVDVIITTSGIQSNWARQTTAGAVKLGMKVVLVLRTAQFKEFPTSYDGNLLLDHLMGAEVRFLKMRIDEDPAPTLDTVARELKNKGHNPYVLHLSETEAPLTTVAYYEAMKEIHSQNRGEDFDYIVVASGGGTTQGGLTLGTKLLKLKTKVLGINVGAFKKKVIVDTILDSAEKACELLGAGDKLNRDDVQVMDDYYGEDYGISTPQSLEAIKLTASTEALIIDPVYTSKAMSGLIDMCRKGVMKKGDRVCFVHTGGVPALFAYRDAFPMNQANTIS
jgi:D-cysteine desulfhydrase family pyridoxal phosphate-dependent enzyme